MRYSNNSKKVDENVINQIQYHSVTKNNEERVEESCNDCVQRFK